MKRILFFLTALLATGCLETYEVFQTDPLGTWPSGLHAVTVRVIYPDGYPARPGVEVQVEEISSGTAYTAPTDADGIARFSLPDGIWRFSSSDRTGRDIFNGTADKVVVTEGRTVDLPLTHSLAGTLVIKELYCGGCSKAPEEGTYQSDKYAILHNNDTETVYLDSLCLGMVSPYNATAVNHWADASGALPAFAPVVEAVWQVGGSGTDFPLPPGGDAVVAINGAIDHTLQYPLSINLNRPDVFVCYNAVSYPNPVYHPAPGDQVRPERILSVVIKTGQANAYPLSISSPTLLLFRAQGATIQDHVQVAENILQAPGSTERATRIPYGWVIDGIEVFDGRSTGNKKRLPDSVDAGFAIQSDVFKGHSLMRKVDEEATATNGFEVLVDTNNSSNDFYESEIQSLHR